VKTKVKVLQYNRLDGKRFLVKTLKASKKLHHTIFESPIQILGTEVFLETDGNRKHRNFPRLRLLNTNNI